MRREDGQHEPELLGVPHGAGRDDGVLDQGDTSTRAQCTDIVRVLTLAADLGETLFFILLEQQAKNLILRSIYIEHQSIK